MLHVHESICKRYECDVPSSHIIYLRKKDSYGLDSLRRDKIYGRERISHKKNSTTLASSFDNEQQCVAIIYFRTTFVRTVNITCTYDTQCSIIRLVESIGRQVKCTECSLTSFSLND